MPSSTVKSPSDQLLSGRVGPPIAIISRSEIRSAERLKTEVSLETRDGDVIGRAGDIVITTHSGERYPILPEIFFGTYEVLGKTGVRMVARRLIHERRAWPVVSDHASFDYGANRGVVLVGRDGWLYQSDENDFGVINAEITTASHVVIGPLDELEHVEWERRYAWGASVLAVLPAVLALFTMFAFVASSSFPLWLGIETVLLLCGFVLAWRMRSERWSARAAVTSAVVLARAFHGVVELLGWAQTKRFATMALWRAAQMKARNRLPSTAEEAEVFAMRMRRLKETLGVTMTAIHVEAKRHKRTEHFTRLGTLVAACLVLVCNVLTLRWEVFRNMHWLEIASIWLPSLVGAFHGFNARRQIVEREALLRELGVELKFVSDRIFGLVPHDAVSNPIVHADLTAALRILCKIIGRHTQRQFEWAITEDSLPPI